MANTSELSRRTHCIQIISVFIVSLSRRRAPGYTQKHHDEHRLAKKVTKATMWKTQAQRKLDCDANDIRKPKISPVSLIYVDELFTSGRTTDNSPTNRLWSEWSTVYSVIKIRSSIFTSEVYGVGEKLPIDSRCFEKQYNNILT